LSTITEETGLEIDVSNLEMMGCWESVYPTTHEACKELGEVKGHHLVVIFAAPLLHPQTATVALQVLVAFHPENCSSNL
jgi:hypothetical protein